MQFEELNLSPDVLNGLRDFNYKEPTPIQEQCIPKILEGKDILASAQTGTGKTGAFVLPILTKVQQHKGQGIRALILAPTRELAKQIDEQIVGLGYYTGVTSATVYGGGGSDDWTRQEKTLYAEQVNIIVATPGRLIDHMTIREINFSNIDFFVLDEADRMLDMGFLGDVRTIESRMPRKRQNLLFSATIPDDIEKFAREITHHPDRINVATRTEAKGVRQIVYKAPEKVKTDLLVHLATDLKMDSTIVFVRTKKGTESLARSLSRAGLKVTSIHGDRTQKEREEALNDFRSGKYNIVVATDVLSRGIDIADVSHIVNYDVPSELDDYIHRIGRTARADAKGDAITLVCKKDERKFQIIEKTMKDKLDFRELPDASWNGEGSRGKENNQGDKSSDSGKSGGRSPRKSGSRNNRKPSGSKGNRGNSKNQKTKTTEQDSSDNGKKTDQKPTSKGRSSGSQRRTNSSRKRQDNRDRSSAKSTKEESAGKTNNRPDRPQNSRKNTRGPRRNKSDRDTAVNYEDVRKQQRQSLRDAQSTKRALMQNKEYSSPQKKGIVGFIKKIFGKDD
ncbi:MAG TPA: DEAD/DEAH box helicase [Balneolales bacterium]|nr:DEAD/DEAH box helicase [Balneolales bacterium]